MDNIVNSRIPCFLQRLNSVRFAAREEYYDYVEKGRINYDDHDECPSIERLLLNSFLNVNSG